MPEALALQIERLRKVSLAVGTRHDTSPREHRRIADAILRGKGAEAERRMRARVEGVLGFLRRRFQANGRGARPTASES